LEEEGKEEENLPKFTGIIPYFVNRLYICRISTFVRLMEFFYSTNGCEYVRIVCEISGRIKCDGGNSPAENILRILVPLNSSLNS
jgi:hypothetical protein